MDWKRTAPCGSYHYGSVLTNVTHSIGSQSQMGASSRMMLFSNRVFKTSVSRQTDTHMNLPGYVRSNSEQDCMQYWVHEESVEDREKMVDGVSLKGSVRLQDAQTIPLEEGEKSRADIEEVL